MHKIAAVALLAALALAPAAAAPAAEPVPCSDSASVCVNNAIARCKKEPDFSSVGGHCTIICYGPVTEENGHKVTAILWRESCCVYSGTPRPHG